MNGGDTSVLVMPGTDYPFMTSPKDGNSVFQVLREFIKPETESTKSTPCVRGPVSLISQIEIDPISLHHQHNTCSSDGGWVCNTLTWVGQIPDVSPSFVG